MEIFSITLKDLPKISTNDIYSGMHWSKRKKIKDDCTFIVKNQFKHVFKKDKHYQVDYVFCWKNRPLDALNCAFISKIIEDIIFEDDKHDIITHVGLSSCKGKEDVVFIKVIELNTTRYE